MVSVKRVRVYSMYGPKRAIKVHSDATTSLPTVPDETLRPFTRRLWCGNAWNTGMLFRSLVLPLEVFVHPQLVLLLVSVCGGCGCA